MRMPALLILAFLAGAAVLIGETAAPRLLAPQLGTGVLTWSAVFATWLLGLAIGCAVGGRIVDAHGPRFLGPAFLASAACLALIPLLSDLLRALLGDVPHGLRVPLTVVPANLPVAIFLGTLPPMLTARALAGPTSPGKAIGRMAAAGAAGSLVGTLLTGFVLIPSFGVRGIHFGTAGMLLMAGLVLLRGSPRVAATPRPPPPATTPPAAALGRYAFLAGAALLVVEIVAGRIAMLRLGASVYTWTSVIAVVLVGLGLGGLLGARLADRHEPRALLARLFLASSGAVATCLWSPVLMVGFASTGGPWALRVLIGTTATFLLPAVALGTLGPALTRLALQDPEHDGRIVGRMQALGTAGAVVAAIATPYALIPFLQVPLLLITVALVLAAAAEFLQGKHEWPWVVTLLFLAFLTRAPLDAARDLGQRLGLREDEPGTYVTDSRYFHIRVKPHEDRWAILPGGLRTEDLPAQATWEAPRNRLVWKGPMSREDFQALHGRLLAPEDAPQLVRLRLRTGHTMRSMSLDRLVHGFVDLHDPRWLEYDYERIAAAIIERAYPPSEKTLRAFFIGGGSYTFQRYLLAARGDATEITSLEIDPAVTEAAERALGLEPDPRHEIVHEDARTWLGRRPGDAPRYDVVLGDAFHDVGVPWHLTTRECAVAVRNVLRADGSGLYLINIIDDPAAGRFLGAVLVTLESVFAHVEILSLPAGKDNPGDTLILCASDRAVDLTDLTPFASAGQTVRRHTASERATLRSKSNGLVLTDDYAPVETLLAPVIEARGERGR
jgi:predicted membrane-bound spermidine synthase